MVYYNFEEVGLNCNNRRVRKYSSTTITHLDFCNAKIDKIIGSVLMNNDPTDIIHVKLSLSSNFKLKSSSFTDLKVAPKVRINLIWPEKKQFNHQKKISKQSKIIITGKESFKSNREKVNASSLSKYVELV